jgi:hypothetical protein
MLKQAILLIKFQILVINIAYFELNIKNLILDINKIPPWPNNELTIVNVDNNNPINQIIKKLIKINNFAKKNRIILLKNEYFKFFQLISKLIEIKTSMFWCIMYFPIIYIQII